jgi:biotin carboxyl carrier protein
MARERATRTNGMRESVEARTLSVADVRKLIRLLKRTDISELSIEDDRGMKLTLRKPAPIALGEVASGEVVDLVGNLAIIAEAESAHDDSVVEVTSPMVGVFRSGMKSGAKPLVAVDGSVRKGQVIAAIESLHVYNEVESSATGKVREVLVHDGDAVEFGQPLVRIERVPA